MSPIQAVARITGWRRLLLSALLVLLALPLIAPLIADEAAKPGGDFRRVLEMLAAPNEGELERKADEKLKEIDNRIDIASNDPLPDIFTGDLWFYDAYQQTWIKGTISVPGNTG